MLKQLCVSRKGEGYIDICVGVVVFVMVMVIAINIFSFVTLRMEMDHIAEELIETATFAGSFDEEFLNTHGYLMETYFYYDASCGADEFLSTYDPRVQLGTRMWVTVSKETYVKGLGIFKIPVMVSVTRSGLSERYWK